MAVSFWAIVVSPGKIHGFIGDGLEHLRLQAKQNGGYSTFFTHLYHFRTSATPTL